MQTIPIYNSKFCILIPTINRADLLKEALFVYTYCFPNTYIYVLDNGNQHIEDFDNSKIFILKENQLGVAESWNHLIAFNDIFDYMLILNDDICLHTTEQAIYDIIDKDDKNTFYVCEPKNNWSAFLLSQSVYSKVGLFDENFERCYYEDNDYHYRIKLNNVNFKHEPRLNPTTYRNSQTIAKNPHLNNSTNNRQYYINKWGGEPNYEIFTKPFNLANLIYSNKKNTY
jgi:GT2 family glycosyltransferase